MQTLWRAYCSNPTMRHAARLAALLSLIVAAPIARAEVTAIVNVNVLPMTSETVIAGQSVLVRDGRIVEIGTVTEVRVPEDSVVVDGTDRYLLPGLWETHAHVTSTQDDEVDRLFRLFLANGVTSIRGMLGRPDHLELREAIAAGRVFGPRLITSGPSLNGNSVNGAAAGRASVRAQFDAGYDFLKIHPGLTADEFAAIADEARRLGMPFAGHVPESVGVPGALTAGIATIDHLDGYLAAMLPADSGAAGGFGGFFGVLLAADADDSEIAGLVAATLRAGTANVPTETLFEQLVSAEAPAALAARPEYRFVPQATLDAWLKRRAETQGDRAFDPQTAARAIELRRRLLRELHAAGAVLLLGSDAPQLFNVPGFSVHRELELLVASGLSPYEALATGTTAPARFFRLGSGTIQIGERADLVLLDANPFEDIRNSRRVHGVIANGRWASARELLRPLEP